MKKIILFVIGILCMLSVSGQQLSPEVISSAGDYFKGSNVTLSWTIGEAVIETFTGTNCILTQGFQQPFISVTGIKKLDDKNLEIIVFPNPASDLLNIHFITKEKTDFIIELIDINGKTIFNNKVPSGQFIKQINLTHIKPGLFFLRIVKTNGEIVESYKIQKIIK